MPATTRAPQRLHDPVARSVREAAHRTVDRAHRYRPNSPIEYLVTRMCPSRGALLRHLHEHHNFDGQQTPPACMSDRELRDHHQDFLHRWDPA